MINKGVVNKVSSLPEVINKGVVNKVVQLFWGCFFDDVFLPFETSNFDPFLFLKLYDLDDPSPFDMFNHQRLDHFH